MLIRLTRLSNDRHRFEIVRDDGTRESLELETRSALLHDLAHYAVEVEAGLNESFYGRLAQGLTYDELTTTPPKTSEAMDTERVVVLVQNTFQRGHAVGAPEEQAQRVMAGFRSTESEPPTWLDGDVISRVQERLRRVQGQWRATPFHGTMELQFPQRQLRPAAPATHSGERPLPSCAGCLKSKRTVRDRGRRRVA